MINHLFKDGAPFYGGTSLFQVLQHHEQKVLNKVREITDIEQLTDETLNAIIAESLVEPIRLGKIARKNGIRHYRQEELPMYRFFPDHCHSEQTFPKTVVTISVAFTGDRVLFQHSPNANPNGFNFPYGTIVGNTIQFEETLWGESDYNSDEKAKENISGNIERLRKVIVCTNAEVEKFNVSIAQKVTDVFKLKAESLVKESGIFDDLGIAEEESQEESRPAALKKPHKRRSATTIIQYVENQYVEQLNQYNKNIGDVKNDIQAIES